MNLSEAGDYLQLFCESLKILKIFQKRFDGKFSREYNGEEY